MLAEACVTPLNSPAHYPRYNGAIEKGIRELKESLIFVSLLGWRPRQESNLNLGFRKPSFYPLNYGDS